MPAYYDEHWSPDDRVFEVKDLAGIEHRGRQTRARKVTVVRELTSAQVFGAAYRRGEALATAIGAATFDQAEKFIAAWRGLPDGWEHCGCTDPHGEETHEPSPGSRGALQEPEFDDERLGRGEQLIAGHAESALKRFATAIWWYRAGRAGVEVGNEPTGCYSGPAPVVPGTGSLWELTEVAATAGNSMISAALCWRSLPPADRQAWAIVASAVGVTAGRT